MRAAISQPTKPAASDPSTELSESASPSLSPPVAAVSSARARRPRRRSGSARCRPPPPGAGRSTRRGSDGGRLGRALRSAGRRADRGGAVRRDPVARSPDGGLGDGCRCRHDVGTSEARANREETLHCLWQGTHWTSDRISDHWATTACRSRNGTLSAGHHVQRRPRVARSPVLTMICPTSSVVATPTPTVSSQTCAAGARRRKPAAAQPGPRMRKAVVTTNRTSPSTPPVIVQDAQHARRDPGHDQEQRHHAPRDAAHASAQRWRARSPGTPFVTGLRSSRPRVIWRWSPDTPADPVGVEV